MYYFPWSAIAWLEFWTAMSRTWIVAPANVSDDPRVVPFPSARVRARTVIGRAASAHIVRLSV